MKDQPQDHPVPDQSAHPTSPGQSLPTVGEKWCCTTESGTRTVTITRVWAADDYTGVSFEWDDNSTSVTSSALRLPVFLGTYKPDPASVEQPAEDTLPAWLYQRFALAANTRGWDDLDDTDRSYWAHHAAAVRRAVARGGFKAGA